MEYRATIRLSDEATLVVSFNDESAKLTAEETVSGKKGTVTLSSGSKKSAAPKEE